MDPHWPVAGPWLLAATSAGADWRIAANALVTVASVPVAALVVGTLADDDTTRLLRSRLDGLLEIPAASAERLTLGQARDLVRALSKAHGLVLVAASAGLLVPLGEGDWTLADLGVAVGAPAVVVTGAGPDAVNHTTLALGALAGHGLPASVVTIGEVDDAALPVAPAGRIPADSPGGGEAEAAEWLNPILHARAAPPPAPPAAPGRRQTVSGKRLVLGLVAAFLVMVAAVCGLAWWNSEPAEVRYSVTIDGRAPATVPSGPRFLGPGSVWSAPAAPRPVPRRSAGDVCPENAGRVTPTRPDAATTARVGAAWRRIEKWLAAHAPASFRALRAPAPAARTDELQRRMSVAFPADLVASLRRHDGVTGIGRFSLPPFFSPESLESIYHDWAVTCGVLATTDTSWAEPWWHRAFIPFAADGGGGSLLVDQRPGGHGRVGEFYPEDGTNFERWPGSVTALLEQTATSLETGRPYAGRYRPRVGADGLLDWEIK